MSRLKEYQEVRIVRLVQPPEHYDGWRDNERPPPVGDTGCIVEILRKAGLPDYYMVESSSQFPSANSTTPISRNDLGSPGAQIATSER